MLACSAPTTPSSSAHDIDGQDFVWHPASAASLEVFAACAASLAYCDPKALQAHLVRAEQVQVHAMENAFAASWLQDGRWTVAFRGTEVKDWRDFLDDVDVRSRPIYWTDAGRAHAGFLRHFYKLQASVLTAALQLPEGACKEVLFTGHSLGGAVAYLAATFFAEIWQKNDLHQKLQVRTFGAPRVGDAALYDSCAKQRPKVSVVSYANSADAVPKLPPNFHENWSEHTVTFRSHDPLLEAHAMKQYLLDVVLSEDRCEKNS